MWQLWNVELTGRIVRNFTNFSSSLEPSHQSFVYFVFRGLRSKVDSITNSQEKPDLFPSFDPTLLPDERPSDPLVRARFTDRHVFPAPGDRVLETLVKDQHPYGYTCWKPC